MWKWRIAALESLVTEQFFQVHPSCCFTVSLIKCFGRDICLIRSYDSVTLITSKFLANVKFLREKDGFI